MPEIVIPPIILLGASQTGRTSVGQALAAVLASKVIASSDAAPVSEVATLSKATPPSEAAPPTAAAAHLQFQELEDTFVAETGVEFETALDQWERDKFHRATTRAALTLLSQIPALRVAALTPSAPQLPEVAEALRDLSQQGVRIVELTADLAVLSRRAGLNAPRPLGLVNANATGPHAMFRQLHEQLRGTYATFSPLIQDTSHTTALQAAEQILRALT